MDAALACATNSSDLIYEVSEWGFFGLVFFVVVVFFFTEKPENDLPGPTDNMTLNIWE